LVEAGSLHDVTMDASPDETLKWIGIGLQAGGGLIALFGLAVVRSAATGTANKLVDKARQSLERMRARRALIMEGLSNWWARRRGRPAVFLRMGGSDAHTSASLTIETKRNRVDRSTVTDREWLEYLDNHLDALFQIITEDRVSINNRVDDARRELRDDIASAVVDGWQIAAVGIGLGVIGTVVGGFA
jgi:hypothetical protein